MEGYRLAAKAHSDLSGNGGLYGAGRWHKKGAPIVYTASSRALSALERFVHEDASTMPKLTMMTIWIPDDSSIKRINKADLPEHWDLIPATSGSQLFGSQWLLSQASLVLEVPSAIIDNEFNYLLNPLHSEAAQLRIVEQRDYYYDARLSKMIR